MIKVIENMEPWEVLKAASEGKRVAYKPVLPSNSDCPWTEFNSPKFDWLHHEYAIIDESQPGLSWDKFDWEFFNQYGGLLIKSDLETYVEVANGLVEQLTDSEFYLRESPFYPWFGGKQPVPDNVEVKVRRIFKNHLGNICDDYYTDRAINFSWTNSRYVAFRLTGRVL